MEIGANFLEKILVNSGLISKEAFEEARKESEAKKQNLIDVLIEKELIGEEELGKLIADEMGFPFVDLKKTKIDESLLKLIPEIVARRQKVILFEKIPSGVKAAMVHPDNLEVKEFLERKTGEKIIPHFTFENHIQFALRLYRKEIKEEFEEICRTSIDNLWKFTPSAFHNLPIAKITDFLIERAYQNQASDIHIEPYSYKTVIRYRIDGKLHDVLILPRALHDFLVARIKILAKLRIDEHDSAQDGHFSFSAPEEKIDIRVSVVPIENGEKVALRLLARKTRRLGVKDLGISEELIPKIRTHLGKSWGLILTVGPTGSGKTTTLYAFLQILNKRELNIMTIEDPIEYDIEGVNQIQVNPKTNLTFAEGLRAILRQDPDIIMVGEIRDQETANLAVNAALTGHLVLSSFHAIDASSAIIRLIDIGIEPFIVASALELIIAQRLVRKICPGCIESYEIKTEELASTFGPKLSAWFSKKGKVLRFFKGKGCRLCQKSGYLGRTGIFEVLEVGEKIKKLIMKGANAREIKEVAQKEGMKTLIEDGLEKAERGITTLEEVLRAYRE